MMLQCSLLSLIILIVVDDTINLLSGYRPGIITITLFFYQFILQSWQCLPIIGKLLYIVLRQATFKMSIDILYNLGITSLNITRNIQIVIILLYLFLWNKTSIMRYVNPCFPCVNNTLDILFTQAVHISILYKAILGINHKDSLTIRCFLLIKNDDAGWDSGTIEKILW